MTTPDLAAFKRLARKGNLIAVSASIPADLETPVSAFLKLAEDQPHCFLLESAEQNETIGRYSFIGLEPKAILTSHRGKITLTEDGKPKEIKGGANFIDILEERLGDCKLAN